MNSRCIAQKMSGTSVDVGDELRSFVTTRRDGCSGRGRSATESSRCDGIVTGSSSRTLLILLLLLIIIIIIIMIIKIKVVMLIIVMLIIVIVFIIIVVLVIIILIINNTDTISQY